MPPRISDSYNGDFNEIKNNLNRAIDAVNALVSDAGLLAKAAVDGKLATRADATKHQGDFQKIVQGVNDTLDAVIGPLNVAAEYVDRISKGDMPKIISDNYNGDFNGIKNNLNFLIEATNGITDNAKKVSQGNLMVELYPSNPDGTLGKGTVTLRVDGVSKTMAAGGQLAMKPGESVCLEQGVYHRFWGEPGKGRVLVGEVSMVNDDTSDNRFLEAIGRFPEVEEDEAPYRLLVSDYRRLAGA